MKPQGLNFLILAQCQENYRDSRESGTYPLACSGFGSPFQSIVKIRESTLSPLVGS